MGQRGVQRYIRDNKNRIQGPYENGMFDTAAIAGQKSVHQYGYELQQLAEKLLGNKIGSAVALIQKPVAYLPWQQALLIILIC